jgi:hypothetical protein
MADAILPCAGADRQPNGAVCAKAPCYRSVSPYADRYDHYGHIRGSFSPFIFLISLIQAKACQRSLWALSFMY